MKNLWTRPLPLNSFTVLHKTHCHKFHNASSFYIVLHLCLEKYFDRSINFSLLNKMIKIFKWVLWTANTTPCLLKHLYQWMLYSKCFINDCFHRPSYMISSPHEIYSHKLQFSKCQILKIGHLFADFSAPSFCPWYIGLHKSVYSILSILDSSIFKVIFIFNWLIIALQYWLLSPIINMN